MGKQHATGRKGRKYVIDNDSRAFFTDGSRYCQLKQDDNQDNKLRLERKKWELKRKVQKPSEVLRAAVLLKQLDLGLTSKKVMSLAWGQCNNV